MLNKDFSRFGGGGVTFFTPLSLLLLTVICVLILVLPRRYRILPFLMGSILVPISQALVIGGLHFMMYRILIAIAWLRIFLDGFGAIKIRVISLDRVLIVWAISAVLTFTVLWGNIEAFVNRLGFLYDAVGTYFALRLLHRGKEDVQRTIRSFAWLCAIVAIAMLVEKITRFNSFSALGGIFPVEVRDGGVRSLGPFAHPILAGTCGAVLFPLFAGLWWRGESALVAAAGMVAATVMTIASESSTAVMAYVSGVVALFMWPARRYMRELRWAVGFLLVALHLVMKAPVWALIGRVDLVGGSSSYHRYELINQAIIHFGDWWLFGQKTTYQWGYNLWDTANTYVETAVTGGVFTLALFIAVIVCGFRRLGMARKASKDPAAARMLWALGAALFANLVGFVGISYFDQTIIVWYSLLALISTATIVREKSPRICPPDRTEIAGDAAWSAGVEPALSARKVL